MATRAHNTLHKEIHPEQEKRVKTEKKLQNAKEGQLPSNSELDTGINKLQTGINLHNDELSPSGKQVTEDINNLLDTAKVIVNDKNDGELLQKTYFHSHQAGSNKSYSERVAELKQMMTGDVSATREDAKKNVTSFATIVKLALLSPEFRASINELSKATNQLLKNQEEKNDGKRAASETKLETNTTRDTNITEKTILPDGTVEATVVESKPVTTIQTKSESKPVDKKARRARREEKMIDRFIDLAQTLHKKPEFRNSVEYLAESSSQLKAFATGKKEKMKAKSNEDKSKENTEAVKEHKQHAKMNGKEFLENWIGDDYSLDPLINQIVYLQKKSKTDPELRQLLADWKKWSTVTIKDESYVNNKERMREDIKDLISRTRMISKRYNQEITIIRRETVFINKSIQRDDTVLKLRSDFQKLANDIVRDSNGNPTLKPELLGDAQIIISSLVESIKYIPLPPIMKSDENMDVELENIVLNATDVTPSNVRFMVQADTDKRVDGTRQHQNSFLIEISKIRAHLTSVNFYVNKKTGFPKITERGLADIDMGGRGLSLKIEIAPRLVKDGNEVHSVFEAKTVGCSIHKLKIHLRETNHDMLLKIASPIINKVAKQKIEVGISKYIQENMNKLNGVASQQATDKGTRANRKIEEKKQHA